MKRLFAVDLDGTLFHPKHPRVMLTKRTKNFIKRIVQNGDVFSVVSGRNFPSCKSVFSLLDEDPYIVGCNGSYIYFKNKYIRDEVLDSKIYNEIYEYITSHYRTIGIYVMTNDDKFILEKPMPNFFYKVGQKMYDLSQGKLLEPYLTDYNLFHKYVDEGKIRKSLFMFGVSKKAKEIARLACMELNEKFKNLAEIVFSNQVVEISPKGCTKSNGVIELAKQLNINHENVFVVGDSGNDISMFQTFYEHSYCIANANENVKKHAKHSIKNFNKLEKEVFER